MKKIILFAVAVLALMAATSEASANEWRGPKDDEDRQHGVWKQFPDNSDTAVEIVTFRHGVRHGANSAFHASGKKSFEGNYKDGELDGEWISYHDNEDNSKSTQGNNKNGARTGEWTEWYSNGQTRSVTNYFNGIQNGAAEGFYSSGGKQFKTTYRNGLHNGAYAGFFDNSDNSQQHQGAYRDNLRTGPWTEWHLNSEKLALLNYTAGKKNGPAEYFYASGQTQFKTIYSQDQHHGPYSEYFDTFDNAQKYKGTHRENERFGKWQEWSDNGNLIADLIYRDGKLHGPAEYYQWYDGDKDYTTVYDEGKQHGPYVKYHWPRPITSNLADFVMGNTLEESEYDAIEEYGEHRKGKREGEWIILEKEGAVKARSNWRNGEKHGLETEYWASVYGDGLIQSKTPYKNGKRHGLEEQFYSDSDSSKRRTGSYQNGSFTGTWTNWYKNGEIEWQGAYGGNGRQTGNWREYDDEGELLKVTTYENGEIVSTQGECNDGSMSCPTN